MPATKGLPRYSSHYEEEKFIEYLDKAHASLKSRIPENLNPDKKTN